MNGKQFNLLKLVFMVNPDATTLIFSDCGETLPYISIRLKNYDLKVIETLTVRYNHCFFSFAYF